jgi:nicotinamide-nucleotide amidase
MSNFPPAVVAAAEDLLTRCRVAGVMLVTAESCTGGLIAGALTEIAGSSDVVERGFVTYSNAAKMALLGVPEVLLIEHGAVSEPVARAMAEGALARSPVDLAISVTGVAGPGGGSVAKPVGLVFVGAAMTGKATKVERHVFPGDRSEIRLVSVHAAITLALALLQTPA